MIIDVIEIKPDNTQSIVQKEVANEEMSHIPTHSMAVGNIEDRIADLELALAALFGGAT